MVEKRVNLSNVNYGDICMRSHSQCLMDEEEYAVLEQELVEALAAAENEN
ncbi:MAG: hypothetical protein IJ535_10005 [Pseudobutyrivibrio sp.]|nr:hypothetical protein [Pseudobutyrivibrio sp.]MBQ8490098.1 hypothetical protein [Pseudobutyrivibrio sp.]